MHWKKIILALLAVGGLLVLEFYAACAAYYWIVPVSPTDMYLQKASGGGSHRPFPVVICQPPPDWHLTLARYNSFLLHDWRVHVDDCAFGLVRFESKDWAVWCGRCGYMVHLTSPGFLLLTGASMAVAVVMFRRGFTVERCH
jgi:hypothetical protein